MSNMFKEGSLKFDFSPIHSVERFDIKHTNPYGMKSVDFVAETVDSTYFIEVKDFQNPKASLRHKADYEMLISAGTEKKSLFAIEMGQKIKDSILRKYAMGEKICKKVIYLLVINLDKLGEFERGLLSSKISGYIPSGLNDNRFAAFSSIAFYLINPEQLDAFGIKCVAD